MVKMLVKWYRLGLWKTLTRPNAIFFMNKAYVYLHVFNAMMLHKIARKVNSTDFITIYKSGLMKRVMKLKE